MKLPRFRQKEKNQKAEDAITGNSDWSRYLQKMNKASRKEGELATVHSEKVLSQAVASWSLRLENASCKLSWLRNSFRCRNSESPLIHDGVQITASSIQSAIDLWWDIGYAGVIILKCKYPYGIDAVAVQACDATIHVVDEALTGLLATAIQRS